MWQAAVEPAVRSGALVAVGVVQEQHPERARLYRQWRRLDWPILVDSLGTLELAVVPVPVAIDASGVVRARGLSPRELDGFLESTFPAVEAPVEWRRAELGDPEVLAERARREDSAAA